MIRTLLHKIFTPRHPWRSVTFSELSEMYLAGFLRTLSTGLAGVFVPLYLLQNGYSLTSVLLYYALFYGLRTALDFPTAHLIARFGPKHIMRVSFLAELAFLWMLININTLPHAIFLLGLMTAVNSSMYYLAYHVDFSKIKHKNHGGKELGFLQIMEKVGGVLGPVIGGLIATFIGPEATFAVAAVAIVIAIIILMLSPEPVITHQKLSFSKLFKKKEWRNYFSFMSFTIEASVAVWLWPVFLASVVFTTNGYLNIGLVSSISILVAILVALPIGRLIDKRHGKLLLKYGTNANSVIHFLRPIATSFSPAVFVAVFNEPTTLLYRMAYIKGFYDAADDYPGQRIAYIVINEFFGNVARCLFWVLLATVSLFTGAYVVCTIGFIVGALASQGIKLQKFKVLQ